MTKVAIAVPVFNGAAYMRECLDSLIRQSFPDWICVINNNYSTDETEKIALEYVQKDSRFHYFKNDSFLPVVGNFNKSFELTLPFGCDFFKCVPSDDWLYEDYLKETVHLLTRHASAGICSAYRLDDVNVNCDGLDVNKGPVFPGRQRLVEEITGTPSVTGSLNTVIYRMETLRKLSRYPVIFDPTNFHCDTELARDLLEISDMAFVFKVLSYTRRHNESVSSQVNRIQTFYSNSYNSLFTRKAAYPELEPHFKKFKLFYAWFIITLFLKGKSEALKWHLANMKRKLGFGDYFASLFIHNPVSRLLRRAR